MKPRPHDDGSQEEELPTSSDSDQEDAPPAAKRARLLGALGLGSHTGPPAAAAAGATIDHTEEAEASLLQLEVGELLAEARPDLEEEGPLLELLQQIAEVVQALPVAEVDGSAVKGLLRDLQFAPAVSPPCRCWACGDACESGPGKGVGPCLPGLLTRLPPPPAVHTCRSPLPSARPPGCKWWAALRWAPRLGRGCA